MRWPWSKKESLQAPSVQKEQERDAISKLDPSLQNFYYEAKPSTPIALTGERQAPQEQPKEHEERADRLEAIYKTQTETGTADHSRGVDEERRTITTTVQAVPVVSDVFSGPTEKQPRRISLQQAARDNCVEFEMALSQCLVKGSLWDRFLSCYPEKMNQQKCNELQEFALTMFGYSADLPESQRKQVVNRADDLMISTIPTTRISEEAAKSFKEAVTKQKQELEKSGGIYRAF